MKKLMYFATGDGANNDLEAYTCLGSAGFSHSTSCGNHYLYVC